MKKNNGYNEWKNLKESQKLKRIAFIKKASLVIIIIAVFVFFFGYDVPLFDKNKIIEFFGGFIALLLFVFVLAILIYKIPKYIPICNKCGQTIKNINKDCIIGKIECIGTIDKTVYETVETTVKGKTEYPRGGYSMRNSTLERTSLSNFKIEQKIPIVKKFYVYQIEYRCKNCNEFYCNQTKESIEPLERNKI